MHYYIFVAFLFVRPAGRLAGMKALALQERNVNYIVNGAWHLVRWFLVGGPRRLYIPPHLMCNLGAGGHVLRPPGLGQWILHPHLDSYGA